LAKLLEGKPLAGKIKDEIKKEIASLRDKPVLASIQVTDNPGAQAYVNQQKKTAEGLGIVYQLHKLAQDTSETSLIEFIHKLNSDKSVNGIIIQMPMPAQIDYKKISQFIVPEKDAEGMHPANIGNIVFAKARILPCTAAAVMELLKETGVDSYGKEAVVVGHSEIVGKPLALLLLDKFATVTVCHIGTSKAGKLEEHVRIAEVLIVAVGKAGLIKASGLNKVQLLLM